MSPENDLSFPYELCCKPIPFVGLTGLDLPKNPAHRFIADAFCKNHNLLPLAFKILPPNHTFPAVKPKRVRFDQYIPKGVLKSNWMKKHLLEIPPVVAVLYELNWDDPNGEASEAQCVQQLQAIRNKVEGLGTKIALILIQKTAPLPSGEDMRSTERAANLCTACKLPNKQLFVVPQDDHLHGYVVRLQTALLELAKAYYTQEIKQIKNHRDYLTKTIHRYLMVRHNFKMAFLSEMKQDDSAACRLYNFAYSDLKEVPTTKTNLHEMKVVAGFINYKYCSLLFRLGKPRDALTQLRGHIQLYKPITGPKSLLFEHYAWLAAQFAAFADLFDEAIRQGLTPVQTEHPGIYYKQAALYSIDRKLTAQEVCQDVELPADFVLTPVEFWGQRCWRPGKLAAEPLDQQAELLGITALQAKEKTVDHSAVIIGYLGNGISQFKTYKCPRMRLQLLVQMAEEYHATRDHGKALTLLSHMIWDYRKEKWWQLLGALLQLGLSSAYLSANLQDYVSFAVEALAPHIPINEQLKTTIYSNLIAVFTMGKPTAHPGGSVLEISNAEMLWSSAVTNTSPIVVDMSNIDTCFAVRYSFAADDFQQLETMGLKIYIKSFCPGPVQFTQISATLTADTQSTEMMAMEQNVHLDGDSVGVFSCSGPIPIDAGKQVTVSVVTVTMATTNGRHISFKLRPFAPVTVLPVEFPVFKRPSQEESEWGPQDAILSTRIAAPQAKVTVAVDNQGPALLGEQFPISVLVTNDDSVNLYNASLEVKLVTAGDEVSPDASTRLSDEQQTSISPKSIKILLENIPAGTSKQTKIFLKGYSNGDRSLSFHFLYSLTEDENVPNRVYATVEQQTTVSVVQPLEVNTRLLTMKFEPTQDCYAHETFLLCTDVKVISPCPITIRHTSLELGLYVANECSKQTSQLAGVTLWPSEVGTDIFPLILTEARPQPVAVGTYVLQWSREGSETTTSSSITLPAVKCLPALLSVSMSLPAHGRVHTPMDVEYKLYNRSSSLLQFDMHIDPSEAFMFSGQKQTVLRLLPETERTLEYKMLPLLSGLLALPRLVLSAAEGADYTSAGENTEQLSTLLERNLPSHVYVMPQEKKALLAAAAS